MRDYFTKLEWSLFFCWDITWWKFRANRRYFYYFYVRFTVYTDRSICQSTSFSKMSKNQINILINVYELVFCKNLSYKLSKFALLYYVWVFIFFNPSLNTRRRFFNHLDINVFVYWWLLLVSSPIVWNHAVDISWWFFFFVISSGSNFIFFDKNFIHNWWNRTRVSSMESKILNHLWLFYSKWFYYLLLV